MKIASTYRAFALALAATVAYPHTAASLLLLPLCSDDAGLNLYNVEAMTGGMTLATGNDTQGRVLILAACDGGTQLVIQSGDDAAAHRRAIDGLTRAIASASVYSFEDMKNRYDSGSYTSAITPISPELCACMTKDN